MARATAVTIDDKLMRAELIWKVIPYIREKPIWQMSIRIAKTIVFLRIVRFCSLFGFIIFSYNKAITFFHFTAHY